MHENTLPNVRSSKATQSTRCLVRSLQTLGDQYVHLYASSLTCMVGLRRVPRVGLLHDKLYIDFRTM